MDLVMQISSMILTVWWAIIVLLWIIVISYIILILSKINYMMWDVKEKYNLITDFIFRPLVIIKYFINKYNK